jgi:hypothetical protein
MLDARPSCSNPRTALFDSTLRVSLGRLGAQRPF